MRYIPVRLPNLLRCIYPRFVNAILKKATGCGRRGADGQPRRASPTSEAPLLFSLSRDAWAGPTPYLLQPFQILQHLLERQHIPVL